jgi:hypothetical protein
MPQADNTDFYMFRSYEPNRLNDDYVTFIVNVQGLQSPYAGPNYYSLSDNHFYEIYVDNTGDGVEDLVYQFLYGTKMGGKQLSVPVRAGDFDCNFTPRNQTINIGIALPIGANNEDILIPFKVAGPIYSNNTAALNWFEYYSLTAIQGDKDSTTRSNFTVAAGHPDAGSSVFTKPFDYAGEKSFPDYQVYADQYIYPVNVPFCGSRTGQVFVGQRTESFFINLGAIFDLINFVPIVAFPTAITNSYSNNDLFDKNIDSFVLEVPSACLTSTGTAQGVIGAWTVIRTLSHGPNGEHIPGNQVSRLGNPLVNELVVGLYDKFTFNGVGPAGDLGNFGKYVLYPTLPEVVQSLFGDAVKAATGLDRFIPKTPRLDLVTAFTTGITGINFLSAGGTTVAEMLRLNVSTAPVAQAQQSTMGVLGGDAAGFPNGRRPGDDVVDIALDVVVAGALCRPGIELNGCNTTDAPIATFLLTDGAPIAATDFLNRFPYLNYPIAGSPRKSSGSSSPATGLTLPSFLAIFVAIAAGFVISFAFFRA